MHIQTESFAKALFPEASVICGRVALSDEARAFLLEGLSPQGYLALLVENELFDDAIRFLVHALPIREAIWWACLTAISWSRSSEEERACLRGVASWVYEPSDARRRGCLPLAEACGMRGGAAYAALAVFWSGGSVAPEGLPEIVPDPSLAPTSVAASILLSVLAGPNSGLRERRVDALTRGVDVANGGNGRMDGDPPVEIEE